MKTVLLVGGVGAQGATVARQLALTGGYHVVVFTRDINDRRALELAQIENVTLAANPAKSGYDLDTFYAEATKVDYVFVNTDGFALGEALEVWWGIRLFETSARAGVKHFVYSGLDSSYRESGYDDSVYVGHYMGKSRVQDFIRAQPTAPMGWSIIRSGPYLETLSDVWKPRIDEDREYHFEYPLGDGAVPFILLDDHGKYVHWLLANTDKSNGLDLGVATAHITGTEIAEAFTRVTGHRARYTSVPVNQWFDANLPNIPQGGELLIGLGVGVDASLLNQTYRQNFTNWFNLYKASNSDGSGLIKRNYQLLDTILPERIRSVEQWMRLSDYDGKHMIILKTGQDRQKRHDEARRGGAERSSE